MLILAAERAKADVAEAVAPFGIAAPLARALLILDSPTPMREMAQQMACDPSYITGLADQLEADGLITRVPGSDRRIKLLVATERGNALRADLAEAIATKSVLERNLSAERRADLASILTDILGSTGEDLVAPQH